nr:MAG TPA: Exonuclease [Caudoviricetes sp.]
MKMFEDNKAPRNAADIISELFVEFKEVEAGPVSQYVSPSGLGCQVSIAWKLKGAPTTPQKESFQSRGFAEAGEDRHKRIQEFLSKTPYWVDVEEYIKAKKLTDLEVVRHDGYEVLLVSKKYQARFKLDGMLFIEGHYYVLEIKTERQAANSYRTGPADKHQKQGIAYTLMLDTERILWIYEGRDFLEQKPFVQYVTKEDKSGLDKYIIDAITHQDEPEKLERDTKGCAYCQFKNYCKMYFKELEKRLKLGGK